MRAIDTRFLCPHIVRFEGKWPLPPVFVPLDLKGASDEELLELIKCGTESQRSNAFSAIYRRYYLDVWRFIRSDVACEADAKDIYGEVWRVVLNRLDEFEWRGIPIKYWLLGVARRKSLERFRELQAENSRCISLTEMHEETEIHRNAALFDTALRLDEDPSAPAPVSSRIRNEVDKLLHRGLSKLSVKQRKIIELIYFRNIHNSTEIGRLLGMKPGTVRQNHKRALERLRELLITSHSSSPAGEKQ
jgi:RNA polymerase sigma factor (sigma-70 family)